MTEEHWQRIYRTRSPDEVGWYEPVPLMSARFVAEAVEAGARSVIDVGGGASSLVDYLLDLGLDRVAVVDISGAGLEVARGRLGDRADRVEWRVGDVTAIEDLGRFDVWHDRAVFHFLIEPGARRRYVELAERTINPGGCAIMATFAPDGPERCSGLPVRRYDARQLAHQCGPGFHLERSEPYLHTTPRGIPQTFVYSLFSRVGAAA